MDQTEQQARLTALKAERAELEAAREAKLVEREASDELEREERAIRELKALEKLEEEHGPIGKKWDRVDTFEGMICVKRPHPATWKKFAELDKVKSEDADRFVRPCRIYPDVPEFNRLIEEEPAALIRCATKCCELAGLRRSEIQGK